MVLFRALDERYATFSGLPLLGSGIKILNACVTLVTTGSISIYIPGVFAFLNVESRPQIGYTSSGAYNTGDRTFCSCRHPIFKIRETNDCSLWHARGRQERSQFAATFQTSVVHFPAVFLRCAPFCGGLKQNIKVSSVFLWFIRGDYTASKIYNSDMGHSIVANLNAARGWRSRQLNLPASSAMTRLRFRLIRTIRLALPTPARCFFSSFRTLKKSVLSISNGDFGCSKTGSSALRSESFPERRT